MGVQFKEFKVSELKQKMVLGEPVKTPTGQVIADAGTILTPAIIARLGFYKIKSVTVALQNDKFSDKKQVSGEGLSSEKTLQQDESLDEAAQREAHSVKANAQDDETSVRQESSSNKITVQPMPEKAEFKNTSVKRETEFIRSSAQVVAPGNIGSASKPTYSQAVKRSATYRTFETEFARLLAKAKEQFDLIVNHRKRVDIRDITTEMSHLASLCPTSIDYFDMLHNMRQNNDSIYAHCLNVALISRQMGVWLDFSESDLASLTIAGLLHDIGKLHVPAEILNKKGRLTEEEFSEIKRHPLYSYEILKNQILDTRIKTAALQHHERCDGSGYPYAKKGDEIEDFSVIVAIADVYDAMTAARVYRSPLCPFQVIAEFEKDGLQKYRPKFILTFLEQIAKTYQNNRVILSNGVSANIVLLNSKHLSQPVVQLNDGSCIDLSRSELYIKALI